MAEVNLSSPVFTDHPAGWQAPTDLVAGFTLAWALELVERTRLSPRDPFAPHVQERLPDCYRFDTLGRLIDFRQHATGADFGRSPIIRLTTLCGAWELFELMNRAWRIRPHDFGQFATLLSYVTGGQDRESLYRDESADLSKCLIAVRVRRAFTDTDEIDLAEKWFLTGDSRLTFPDVRGNDSLLFHLNGMSTVPIGLFAHQFVSAIWSTARVTVNRLGADRAIALHGDRVSSLADLLERGGEKAARAERQLAPMQFQYFNNWPGWSD